MTRQSELFPAKHILTVNWGDVLKDVALIPVFQVIFVIGFFIVAAIVSFVFLFVVQWNYPGLLGALDDSIGFWVEITMHLACAFFLFLGYVYAAKLMRPRPLNYVIIVAVLIVVIANFIGYVAFSGSDFSEYELYEVSVVDQVFWFVWALALEVMIAIAAYFYLRRRCRVVRKV